jgi:hypothetical protein
MPMPHEVLNRQVLATSTAEDTVRALRNEKVIKVFSDRAPFTAIVKDNER